MNHKTTIKTKHKGGISIMIPAYNEQRYIKSVATRVARLAAKYFYDYEVLVFNDKSTDKTPQIVDELAKKNRHIKVFHNKTNMGWGYNYKSGIKHATKKYFMYFPGDAYKEPIEHILARTGEADLIIPYIQNQRDRGFLRYMVSVGYVKTINMLFGLDLKYYNGFVISKTSEIRKLHLTTDSFALQTEALIKLLKKKSTYVQVPYICVPQGKTNIFRIKNIIGVFKTIIKLFFNVNIRKKY